MIFPATTATYAAILALVYLGISFLVDLLYGLLDPRIGRA